MIKIGLIIAATSSLNAERIKNLAPKGCKIQPLVYNFPEEIITIYEKHHWFLDGILFGGIFSQRTVENYSKIRIPYTCIKVGDSDFLSTLVSLAVDGYRNFSRIATDIYSSCQRFSKSLGCDNIPIAIGQTMVDLSAFEHSKLSFALLARQNKIDIVITRFSAISKELESMGVRVIEVKNSDESCSREIEALVTAIRNRQVHNNLPAAGLVCNRDQAGSDAYNLESVFLVEALNAFNANHSMRLMIHPIGLDCEVLTSNADLYILTQGYTNCLLSQYLKKTLSFDVSIGWGVGMTVDEAYNCAATALVSETSAKCSSVLQNGNGNRTLALNQKNILNFEVLPPKLRSVEGISTRNLHKLYDVITSRGLYQLSNEEIAYYLDITTRSALRIASALVENKIAVISHKQQYKVKGRPAIIYKFEPENFGDNI